MDCIVEEDRSVPFAGWVNCACVQSEGACLDKRCYGDNGASECIGAGTSGPALLPQTSGMLTYTVHVCN